MSTPTPRLPLALLALVLTLSVGFAAYQVEEEPDPTTPRGVDASRNSATPNEPVSDVSRAALLMIEFQREWLDEDVGKLYALMEDPELFGTSRRGALVALRAARASGMHVLHSPTLLEIGYPELGGQGTGGLFRAIPDAGTWTGEGRAFADGFEPEEGEFVVGGRIGASAFASSNLDVYLRNNQITDVYLAGYAAHVCVESTLREGHDLGYTMHVIEDAVSAFTAEQQDHVMNEVVHHYGYHLTSDEFAKDLSERVP